MRILVTGVTGQVGKALVAPLARLGTVVPSDRSTLNLAEPATLAGALDHELTSKTFKALEAAAAV